MIEINGFRLEPTIFPDGTSQVWRLPEKVVEADDLQVDWRFENERELLDLVQLRELCPNSRLCLYVPFLPYGRQDKPVSNEATFALRAFARVVNILRPFHFTTIDAHNPKLTATLITSFENVHPMNFHREIVGIEGARAIIYPDEGALQRYGGTFTAEKFMVFEKKRNQYTGAITGHRLARYSKNAQFLERFLILDDICDGGATFLSVAEVLRKECLEAGAPRPRIALFVTHGIFSKGIEHLLENGIDAVYTTDSLIKNRNIKGVIKV